MRDYLDRRGTPPSGSPHLPGVPHLHVNRRSEKWYRVHNMDKTQCRHKYNNKIKNTQWCDRTTNWLCTCKYGRGVEFRSTEIKLQFVRGTWTSDLGLLIRCVRWPSWPRSLPPDTHLAVLVDRNRAQSCSERHSFLEQQVCLPWTQ